MTNITKNAPKPTLTFSQLQEDARREAIQTYIKNPLRREVRGEIFDLFEAIHLASDKAIEVTLIDFSTSSMEIETTILKDYYDPISFAVHLANNLKLSRNDDVCEFRISLENVIQEEIDRLKYRLDNNPPLSSEDFVVKALTGLLKLTVEDYAQTMRSRIDNLVVGHLKNELFHPDGSRA